MLARLCKRFWQDQEGVILVETLLAVPVLTLLTFGILEFGNALWQRQQLQVGVRDAARYWSRCRPTFHDCSVAKAANIAVYGNPDGTGSPRVPGWSTLGVTILPAVPNPTPTDADIVTVTGTTTYLGSPFYDAVFGGSVKIGYWAQMRYVGW